ncbi:MAG: hypothetical protein ABL921_10900 [Pirellula sp.]
MSMASFVRTWFPVSTVVALETLKRAAFPTVASRRIEQALQSLGFPDCVLSGPFQGMRYIRQAAGSAYLPKIVGSYESELHDVVRELLSMPIDCVIDIGTAEGYYAVGFAYKRPDLRVIGYDIDRRARFLLNRLAIANNVQRKIEIKVAASPETLEVDLSNTSRPLVICDCEGFEGDLLDANLTPSLKKSIVLVEVHDFIRPNLTRDLLAKFEATHSIQRISTRSTPKIPAHIDLDKGFVELLDEGRPAPQVWLYMSPKSPISDRLASE